MIVEPVELRSLVSTLRSRHAVVGIYADDVPAAMPGNGLQLAELVFGGLGIGRNAGVDGDSHA
jgi:hypothetical protein